jgi:hypothetical protein
MTDQTPLPEAATKAPLPKARARWWQSPKQVGVLGTFISAVVAVLTGLTNFSIEQTKLAAEDDARQLRARAEKQAREDKLAAEREDRLDANKAAEQKLSAKYVDMALAEVLCVDHRVRIFGYLASALTDQDQRAWASRELKAARSEQEPLNSLREALGKLREESASLLVDLAKRYGKDTMFDPAVGGLEQQDETRQKEIALLEQRIAEADCPDRIGSVEARSTPE